MDSHCGQLLRSGNTCRKLRNHKGRHRGTQHSMKLARFDSSFADLLRKVAASMGLDPSDPASIMAVAKALAEKASA